MKKQNIAFAAYIAFGSAWAFFTGDWVVPSIMAFAVIPAWCFAGDDGKKRLAEWQSR